ncbi:MAG TPA: ABC transporter permease, partial [Aestuariivirgaceae bacterium]|nr:ABC transporter permease [Aestuariivirgaceae bacterium]
MGLIVFLILLYLAGVYINPKFFGSAAALSSVMRDAARYGVMAVGMTFVIVNKDLDLSVGSLYGLTAAVFAVSFAPSYFNSGLFAAITLTLAAGLFAGLINGVLVTTLRVPAFIATLTMLFIGRGIVTGVSGGKTISFLAKAKEHPEFFFLGENNAWGLNNQAFVFAVFAGIGMVLLAKTKIGYQTFSTGGNELASAYAGIPTHWVRMRAFLLSAFCATVAGMMQVAQDRALIAQSGQGLELIVIASVIV